MIVADGLRAARLSRRGEPDGEDQAEARLRTRAANFPAQALPPRLPNRLFTSSKEKPCCVAHASSRVTSTGSGRVRDASSARSGHPA
jgi:hypothetical protein